MFVDGLIEGVIVRDAQKHHDSRGWLCELFRSDEIAAELLPQMAYLSETLPGVVRGPHEHRRQTDYFAFLGPGDFRVYLWDLRAGSPTRGHRASLVAGVSAPRIVVIPPGVVHAYRNVSEGIGWVFNAPNRLYAGPGRSETVDEIRHEQQADSPFQLWH